MKYIYIICLALSSFFTYNSSLADTHPCSNAFFIPGGAFQQNTSVEDLTPKRQNRIQTVNKPTIAKPLPEFRKQQAPQTEKQAVKRAASPTTQASKQVETAAVKKANSPQKQVTAQNKKQQPAPKKQPKYKLDDSPLQTPEIKIAVAQDIPPLEKFRQQDLKEMLNTLPYPNFNLPKFKQIYALYALELRSAYRRGKLPSNYEQDETLAKANSIRRFNIK